MAEDRRQAREWLEEMGFVLPAAESSEEAEHAAFISKLASLLAEQRERLKMQVEALRHRRVA